MRPVYAAQRQGARDFYSATINKITPPPTLPRLRKAVAAAGRYMSERNAVPRRSMAQTGLQPMTATLTPPGPPREAIRDELLPLLIGGAWRIPDRTGVAVRNASDPNALAIVGSSPDFLPPARGRRSWRKLGRSPCWSAEPYMHPRGTLNTEGVAPCSAVHRMQGCNVWHNPRCRALVSVENILSPAASIPTRRLHLASRNSRNHTANHHNA